MKKTVMILIILICIALVFTGGMLIVKEKNIDMSNLENQGKTFYANIKEIREYNGITMLLVEGLEINNVNNKGEFTFNISNTLVLFKGELVGKEKLKKGMLISIEKYDAILETYPAQLKDVKSITIIQDELK